MTTIETTATETTTTPATSSAPQCCKCDRPATLRFAWPWGAVDHCCELDRVTVTNNFAALGGPPPRFDEINPARAASELETVPPPRLPHDAGAQPTGAQQLTSSTAHNALPEGTIALVNITNRAGVQRFMLRRPGQGDVDGGIGELVVVLQTLGLIPTATVPRPPIVQQSTDSLPASAAASLASAGTVQRPVPVPNLAPPPPIRPPTVQNPGMRTRVAGRHPLTAPGVLAGAALPRLEGGGPGAQASPPPASSAPPVSPAPAGGGSVVEGDGRDTPPPPTKPDP